MKVLAVRFEAQLRDVEAWLETDLHHIGSRAIFDHIQTFRDLCETTFKGAKVECNFYVRTELFESLIDVNWTDTPARHRAILCRHLKNDFANFAVFWATLSAPADRYAYRGMNLELDSCGGMDREELEEIIAEKIQD